MTLDPQTLIAQATSAAGNAVATLVLQKKGASAVAGLQALAVALPKIPVGGVSPFQMGAISAQIQQATSLTTDPALTAQIGSFLALIATTEAAATGGDITATQALLVASAQNLANGVNNAVQFFLGEQSVLNPAPAAAPAS
jgi:hypothetical protein